MTGTRARPPFAWAVSVTAAIVVGVAGLVVLVVGWFLGVDAVRSVLPGLVTMKVNTSIGFVLFSVAANPLVRERHRGASDVAAILLLVLGAATVLQYVAGVDLGIDELLLDDPTATGASVPGRPGLNTAIGFVLLGLGSLLGDHRNDRPARFGAQAASFVVLALSSLALLGYLLGASTARGIGSATEMALHTSVMFVIACVGLAARTADIGLLTVLVDEGDTGRSARVVLPVTVGALLTGVVLVEALAALDVLADARLQLALTATVGTLVTAVAVLVSMRLLAILEVRADRDRAELAAVRAAFPDVHLSVDEAGSVQAVHGDASRYGVNAEVGRPLTETLTGATRERFLDGLDAARAEDRLVSTTYEIDGEGQSEGSYEARFVHFGHDRVAVAVRDVSDIAAAQRDLRELAESLERQVAERTEELARANIELERFAYLASHDLQEPLRMVMGFVSRIGERYGDQLDERGQQYVHYAVDGAQRMQRLIEGLLAYSRAGRLDPDRGGPTDLAEVVEDVLAVLPLDDHDARVERDLARAEALGDPVLLRQVVQNLLVNALKFRRDDVTPVLHVVTSAGQDEVRLVVEDNGIGIAPEHRAAIFEMFRRFSGRGEDRGTGIGLSLVQQIVTAHGGRIDVEGASTGAGSRFTVVLPRAGGTP